IGPLLAGLLVQYAPAPLHLSFIVHIVLAVLAGVAVPIAPANPPRPRPIRGARGVGAPRGPAGFAVAPPPPLPRLAAAGAFSAVAPSFVAQVVGIGNHAIAGLIAGSIFFASAAAQIAARNLNPQRAVAIGCAILVAGMVILAVALQLSSLTGLVAAAVVAGI